MPWGAQVTEDARVRFALWAPAAGTVSVLLGRGDGGAELALAPGDAGWFSLVTGEAVPGSLYRFRIDGADLVPDPASRSQPHGVHGPSEVIDPGAFVWQDADWRGRPWHEAVIYELHVGAFSERGDFAGVEHRLDELAGLGITALELMPVAAFPGTRNWGYDGVLPYAPERSYGGPAGLKRLVQAAHGRGLMVLLDVVYNHFGPEGNYLHRYAPQFFTTRHRTPWGDGINFDGEHSETVRSFFIDNALYWLEEYGLDGLRLDAVHAIADDSRPDILTELAQRVRERYAGDRRVHLVLENDDNAARYLDPAADGGYDAQWNDDIHHALHVLLTGEKDGYYADYADEPAAALARCLAEGFAYQGEPSPHRGGEARGEPSAALPPTAFVSFLQNHDQVGNRAFGERIHALAPAPAVRVATALLLLAPSPPLVFMGQEFAAETPFLFFCDFGEGLAEAVAEGRRGEFARFARFAAAGSRAAIPDPNDEATFLRSRLARDAAGQARQAREARFFARLLALRHEEIVPRLAGIGGGAGRLLGARAGALQVEWTLADGSVLAVAANLDDGAAPPDVIQAPHGRNLFAWPEAAAAELAVGTLPPWSVVSTLGVESRA